ncbi:MAG TPA: tetratricopeptide repeat protein [Micromonosporaceae bacterium]|nr:tetratricopeptide repeat protein [Micromonosporaceae bacterium]
MAGWPRWARRDAPGSLLHYVQYGVIPRMLGGGGMPAAGDGRPPLDRLRLLYEAFAARRIRYADEPATSEPGRQAIRPPDQVLVTPRHGTCLDLCVTYAGACLDAGLHPMVVVLDPARPGAVGHAVVVVWLGGQDWAGRAADGYPLARKPAVHGRLPEAMLDELRAAAGESGAFAAVDVSAVATRRGRSGEESPPASFDQALADGARMLTGGDWSWSIGVEVAAYRIGDALAVPGGVERVPLVPGYLGLEAEPTAGPLEQLRARRGVVPFYRRDELDLLLEWCQAAEPADRTRIAVVHGAGGAGKTHLAAELCARLDGQRWLTGFLTRHPDNDGLWWLATVVSPLLVVVDYAEAAKSAGVVNLVTALRQRAGGPTCVLLTARAVGSWWTDDIAAPLLRDGVPHLVLPPVRLGDHHPQVRGVFRHAVRAFAQRRGVPVPGRTDPPAGRWTTLDLVMHAWLTAHGVTDLPADPDALYSEIIDRELRYWRDTVIGRFGEGARPTGGVLPAAAACVTLLAPAPDRLRHVLTAVDELREDPRSRAQAAEVISSLLPPDPGDGTVAVRPDPIGDHQALRAFGADEELFLRCLRAASEAEQRNACIMLTRAAQAGDSERSPAARLAATALDGCPALWRAALAVAAGQGGPLLPALEALAGSEHAPQPLLETAISVPPGHATLRQLALVATQCSRPAGHAETSDEDPAAELAAWWNNLAVRQAEVGQRSEALHSITEAVTHYRQLAQANPAAFLPDLAMSLNNLANHQAQVGQRSEALHSITEAVTILRQLALANPAAFLPDLAGSLNNLANRQAEVGQRTEALHSITEAVTHYRQLAQANPAAFLPDLATSLNNLANQLAAAGQPAQAVAAYDQATTGLRPAAQAELLLHRARWRAEQGDTDGAGDDVRRAATAADNDDDPAWAGRARRAVRAMAGDLSTGGQAAPDPVAGLPAWACEPLPDQLLETLDRWTSAPGWASREELLRECHAGLLSAPGQHALQLAEALYPEVEEIAGLRWVLGRIAEHGLEPVLADQRAGHDHAELLGQWLDTATWTDSHELARRHPQLLADPRTAETLEAGPDDPMLVQHLGIVRLAARLPLDDVYDLVIDPTMAVDTAMDAVEEGDAAMLAELFRAAPHLGTMPFVAPYLFGTLLVLSDAAGQDGADEQMRSAAGEGTQAQRAAGAARLRRLARRLPHLAGRLTALAGVLTAPAPVEASPDDPDTGAPVT